MNFERGNNTTYAGYGGGNKEKTKTTNSNRTQQTYFEKKGEVADLQK